jgi:hypothetical protein
MRKSFGVAPGRLFSSYPDAPFVDSKWPLNEKPSAGAEAEKVERLNIAFNLALPPRSPFACETSAQINLGRDHREHTENPAKASHNGKYQAVRALTGENQKDQVHTDGQQQRCPADRSVKNCSLPMHGRTYPLYVKARPGLLPSRAFEAVLVGLGNNPARHLR